MTLYRRRILWSALTVSLLAHICALWWWRNLMPAPAAWPQPKLPDKQRALRKLHELATEDS